MGLFDSIDEKREQQRGGSLGVREGRQTAAEAIAEMRREAGTTGVTPDLSVSRLGGAVVEELKAGVSGRLAGAGVFTKGMEANTKSWQAEARAFAQKQNMPRHAGPEKNQYKEVAADILAASASDFLAADPEFEVSSGFIENQLRSLTQLGTQLTIGMLGGPAVAIPDMAAFIMGGTYKNLQKKNEQYKKITPQQRYQAERLGQKLPEPMTEERMQTASMLNALGQAPMEYAGAFAQKIPGMKQGLTYIDKVTKGLQKKAKSAIMKRAQGMMGWMVKKGGPELATEYAQKIGPETLAELWAENPTDEAVNKWVDALQEWELHDAALREGGHAALSTLILRGSAAGAKAGVQKLAQKQADKATDLTPDERAANFAEVEKALKQAEEVPTDEQAERLERRKAEAAERQAKAKPVESKFKEPKRATAKETEQDIAEGGVLPPTFAEMSKDAGVSKAKDKPALVSQAMKKPAPKPKGEPKDVRKGTGGMYKVVAPEGKAAPVVEPKPEPKPAEPKPDPNFGADKFAARKYGESIVGNAKAINALKRKRKNTIKKVAQLQKEGKLQEAVDLAAESDAAGEAITLAEGGSLTIPERTKLPEDVKQKLAEEKRVKDAEIAEELKKQEAPKPAKATKPAKKQKVGKPTALASEEAVAIRYKGKVYRTAGIHGQAMDDAAKELGVSVDDIAKDAESGFIADNGEFIDRKTALKLAKKAKQLDKKPVSSPKELKDVGLDSVDLDMDKFDQEEDDVEVPDLDWDAPTTEKVKAGVPAGKAKVVPTEGKADWLPGTETKAEEPAKRGRPAKKKKKQPKIAYGDMTQPIIVKADGTEVPMGKHPSLAPSKMSKGARAKAKKEITRAQKKLEPGERIIYKNKKGENVELEVVQQKLDEAIDKKQEELQAENIAAQKKANAAKLKAKKEGKPVKKPVEEEKPVEPAKIDKEAQEAEYKKVENKIDRTAGKLFGFVPKVKFDQSGMAKTKISEKAAMGEEAAAVVKVQLLERIRAGEKIPDNYDARKALLNAFKEVAKPVGGRGVYAKVTKVAADETKMADTSETVDEAGVDLDRGEIEVGDNVKLASAAEDVQAASSLEVRAKNKKMHTPDEILEGEAADLGVKINLGNYPKAMRILDDKMIEEKGGALTALIKLKQRINKLYQPGKTVDTSKMDPEMKAAVIAEIQKSMAAQEKRDSADRAERLERLITALARDEGIDPKSLKERIEALTIKAGSEGKIRAPFGFVEGEADDTTTSGKGGGGGISPTTLTRQRPPMDPERAYKVWNKKGGKSGKGWATERAANEAKDALMVGRKDDKFRYTDAVRDPKTKRWYIKVSQPYLPGVLVRGVQPGVEKPVPKKRVPVERAIKKINIDRAKAAEARKKADLKKQAKLEAASSKRDVERAAAVKAAAEEARKERREAVKPPKKETRNVRTQEVPDPVFQRLSVDSPDTASTMFPGKRVKGVKPLEGKKVTYQRGTAMPNGTIVKNMRGGMEMYIPGREDLFKIPAKAAEMWTKAMDKTGNYLLNNKISNRVQAWSAVDAILQGVVSKYGLDKDFQGIDKDMRLQIHKSKVISKRLELALERINGQFERMSGETVDFFEGKTGEKLEAAKKAMEKRKLQVAEGGITAFGDKYIAAKAAAKEFAKLEQALREYGLLDDHQFRELNKRERAAAVRELQILGVKMKGIEESDGLDPSEKAKELKKLRDEQKKIIVRLQIHYKNSGVNYIRHIKEQIDMVSSYQRMIGLESMSRKWENRRLNWKTKEENGVMKVWREPSKYMGPTSQLVGKGISQEAYDLHLWELFNNIAKTAEDGDGVVTNPIQNEKGEWVSASVPWAVTDPKKYPKGTYVQFANDSKKFGNLAGLHVEKHIAKELESSFKEITDFNRAWRKAFAGWKAGKTVWNPATSARNFMSNAMLANILGDVNIFTTKQWAEFGRSFGEVAKVKRGLVPTDQYAKEILEETTIYSSSFQAAEIGIEGKDYLTQGLTKITEALAEKVPSEGMAKLIRESADFGPWLYDQMEVAMKSVVYKNARNNGMSIQDAEALAHKSLFDYTDVPPAIKWMRNWYSPFITYSYKALPALAQQAIRKPWKFAPYYGMLYGMQELTNFMMGEDEDELEAKKRLLPDYMTRDTIPAGHFPNHVRLPFKTPDGQDKYWDISFLVPWGGATEMAEGALSWVPSYLAPSSPLLTLPAVFLSKNDLFTGKPIVLDTDTSGEYAWKLFVHVYNELAPTAISEKKLQKMVGAFFGDKNVTGKQKYSVTDALLDYTVGIKLRNIDYQEQAMWRATDLQEQARSLREEYSKKLRDASFYKADRPFSGESKVQKLMEEYTDKIDVIQKQLEYRFMEGNDR